MQHAPQGQQEPAQCGDRGQARPVPEHSRGRPGPSPEAPPIVGRRKPVPLTRSTGRSSWDRGCGCRSHPEGRIGAESWRQGGPGCRRLAPGSGWAGAGPGSGLRATGPLPHHPRLGPHTCCLEPPRLQRVPLRNGTCSSHSFQNPATRSLWRQGHRLRAVRAFKEAKTKRIWTKGYKKEKVLGGREQLSGTSGLLSSSGGA